MCDIIVLEGEKDMEKGSVHIIIQRDAKNVPFAKVLYNGQDSFNLDDNMKIFAGYLASKSAIEHKDEGLVFVSTETGDVLETGQVDRLMDSGYSISGSEIGRQYVENLISTIRCGASNKDIKASVFVTDGKIPPIFINEEDISESYGQVDMSIRERQETEKLQLLDSLLAQPSLSHSKKM